MSENLNEHKHYTILQWNFYMVETELENLARETRSQLPSVKNNIPMSTEPVKIMRQKSRKLYIQMTPENNRDIGLDL